MGTICCSMSAILEPFSSWYCVQYQLEKGSKRAETSQRILCYFYYTYFEDIVIIGISCSGLAEVCTLGTPLLFYVELELGKSDVT